MYVVQYNLLQVVAYFEGKEHSSNTRINSASGLIMSCISELFRTPSERTMGMSIPKERLCLISMPMGSGVVAVLVDVGHSNTYYATFQIM